MLNLHCPLTSCVWSHSIPIAQGESVGVASTGLQHQNVPACVENQSFAYPCPQLAVSVEVVRLLLYVPHDVAVDS